jgi:hypothetical protein
MEITDVPFAFLRFQYQLARFPLQLIGEQVVAGMGSEAPTRLFYERWLGGLDASVGKMLGDPDLEKRGAALMQRSDALRRAAQLDATATQNQEQADDDLKAKRDKAIEDQKEARAVKEREVEEARTAAEERKRAAAEAAQKRNSAAKQQADELAAQRMTLAEAAKRRSSQIRRPSRSHRGCGVLLDDAQAKRMTLPAARTGRPEESNPREGNANLSG